jgi:hypothetical protein
MKITRRLCLVWLATVCAAAGLTVVRATPALAAYNECTVVWFTTTCSTKAIPANKSDHYVHVTTYESWGPFGNPICWPSEIRWKVVDADNGVVVGRGSGKGSWTINGLYGRYYGRIDTCPRMTISIENW